MIFLAAVSQSLQPPDPPESDFLGHQQSTGFTLSIFRSVCPALDAEKQNPCRYYLLFSSASEHQQPSINISPARLR